MARGDGSRSISAGLYYAVLSTLLRHNTRTHASGNIGSAVGTLHIDHNNLVEGRKSLQTALQMLRRIVGLHHGRYFRAFVHFFFPLINSLMRRLRHKRA